MKVKRENEKCKCKSEKHVEITSVDIDFLTKNVMRVWL
jgi:hypothetical protein